MAAKGPERAAVDALLPATALHFVLHIGYFKAKRQFFVYDIETVRDDALHVLNRYFPNRRNVKQIQAVQISTLQTVREVAASLPSLIKLPNGPTIEGLPTLAQVVELNSSFATQVLDQQQGFASQLAEVFSPAVKSSI